jgi:hypothetical protein
VEISATAVTAQIRPRPKRADAVSSQCSVASNQGKETRG